MSEPETITLHRDGKEFLLREPELLRFTLKPQGLEYECDSACALLDEMGSYFRSLAASEAFTYWMLKARRMRTTPCKDFSMSLEVGKTIEQYEEWAMDWARWGGLIDE